MSSCDICDELAAIKATLADHGDKLSILLTGVGKLVEAAAGFQVDGVRMEATDWVYSATNWADSPTGSLFLWQKITPSLASNMTIIGLDGSSGMFDFVGADLSIFPYIYDSTEANYVYGTSAASSYAEDTWLPVFLDWKTNETTGNKILQLHIGDTAITISPTDDGTSSFTVPWNGRTLVVGNGASGIASNPFNGDMAEFWLSMTRLDFSVEANRRKFYSATGKPVDVGSDGSTPTGSAPEVYLSVRPGDAASDFATNRGTGGNFTENGTLTIAASSPSD